MKSRQTSSAYRRVQRAASLVAVVALALCPTASSFVVSNPPTQATLSKHAAAGSGSVTRVSVDSPRERLRLQRPSIPAASSAMEDATGTGDADSGGVGTTAIGPDGVTVGGGEVMTAGGIAVFPTAATAAGVTAVDGTEGREGRGASSLLALSSAPAKTEIPTDVAVVGAPQQVSGSQGSRARSHGNLAFAAALRMYKVSQSVLYLVRVCQVYDAKRYDPITILDAEVASTRVQEFSTGMRCNV